MKRYCKVIGIMSLKLQLNHQLKYRRKKKKITPLELLESTPLDLRPKARWLLKSIKQRAKLTDDDQLITDENELVKDSNFVSFSLVL